MVDHLKEARESIQSMWTGVCNIYYYGKVKNNGITSLSEKILYENEPCRISFKNITQTNQSSTIGSTTQVIKLFVSNSLNIPAGSTIDVTQNGITRKYKHSGVSAIYTNHQEIILEIVQEKA